MTKSLPVTVPTPQAESSAGYALAYGSCSMPVAFAVPAVAQAALHVPVGLGAAFDRLSIFVSELLQCFDTPQI